MRGLEERIVFKFLRALCAVPLAALLCATPANAAQIVSLDVWPPDSSGEFQVFGDFNWPGDGQKALAKLEFGGLEFLYGEYTGLLEQRVTWWDDAMGGVTGNEYLYAVDCYLSDGCINIVAPGLAYAWLKTPRGFSKPCTPATIGDCSVTYEPQFGSFFGVFRTANGDDPIQLSLTIGDPIAVPEPEAWALLIAGFGLMGAALRQRRRVGLA
jgi:hypothetical protein